MTGVQEGCLVLADISGYTRYLAGAELEHSADVLADLLTAVVAPLEGTFRIAKLEGDAVFAYGPGLVDGKTVWGSIEACYGGFVDRRDVIARATTCTCKACGRIDALELKLVLHHGKYAMQKVGRKQELVGSDVVLAHRLLKNSVTRRSGLRGYALFSDACLDALGLDAERLGMTGHAQRYEGVGQVAGSVYDLEGRWRQIREQRRIYVGPSDTNLVWEFETAAPSPVAWDYLTSPTKQVLWRADKETHDNPKGVPGVGSVAHCVHGKMTLVHEVVDWKPFRYYSYRSQVPVLGLFLCTDEISPAGDGRWRVSHRVKPIGGMKQRVLLKAFGGKQRVAMEEGTAKLERVLAAAVEHG